MNSQHTLNGIKNRLKEYREHENDAYDFDPGETKAVKNLQNNAADDIEFLLKLLSTEYRSF